MKKALICIIAVLLASIIAFAFREGKHAPRSGSSSCSGYIQNYYVDFKSIALHFNFSDSADKNGIPYNSPDYNSDRQELTQAHSCPYDGSTSGYISSFNDLFIRYDDYYREDPNRLPSISVTYSGNCDGIVSIDYCPITSYSYNSVNGSVSGNTLWRAPKFGQYEIIQGAMTIKSIKTKQNGLQLKWQYTITSNDVTNLDAIATTKGTTVSVAPIDLYALVSSSVLPSNYIDDRHGNIELDLESVAVRKPQVSSIVKSNYESFVIIENTIPRDLAGKNARIIPSDKVVCSPQLEGPIYIAGEYSTSVKWNKPLVYGITDIK